MYFTVHHLPFVTYLLTSRNQLSIMVRNESIISDYCHEKIILGMQYEEYNQIKNNLLPGKTCMVEYCSNE